MDVDPRLQISDLTDYQFQSSLSQYNNDYRTDNGAGYFQHLPANESRLGSGRQSTNSSRSDSIRPTAQESLSASSHRASLANTISGSFPRRTNSQNSNSGMRPATQSPKQLGLGYVRSYPTPSSEQSENEVKDPTVFVPPHLLAPQLVPNPPSLKEWRNKFFNIDEPILLTSEQYLTYFPHVDNIYSHRSTQKYKRKPFVSHYWDCRLKGRPTGTPMNKKAKIDDDAADTEKKKRKRKVRERDLCDVKIKVTEFFGTDELEALRKLGLGPDPSSTAPEADATDLTFVLNHTQQRKDQTDSTFGILEPAQSYPPGHPGYGGRKWYMVQRVNGNDKDGDEEDGQDLDHKHTLEESDRIKKNSVQRWIATKDKERKKAKREAEKSNNSEPDEDSSPNSVPSSRFHATGFALQTLYSHATPTTNQITFYGSSFCPFAQRVWIALEFIGIPYQYVEITEHHWTKPENPSSINPPKLNIPELADCNPEGKVPCLKHNNFAVWESLVVLEYLEDLGMGQSLFQPAVGNAQLKAHSRLWVDFINRRVLPVFYALLLLPDTDGDSNGNVTGNLGSTGQPVVNIAGQHAHANPNAARNGKFNDERYGMPMPSHQPWIPDRQKCDLTDRPLPPASSQSPHYNFKLQTLIKTLHSSITTLVNASHRTGPFFLGTTLSYVDIVFAPFIIRLSRVLAYYRGFPRPEVGTRWQAWCDAIENNETIRRTVSEEQTYREVYGGISQFQYDSIGRVDLYQARSNNTYFPELPHVKKMIEAEGFGMGGDIWGQMAGEKGW